MNINFQDIMTLKTSNEFDEIIKKSDLPVLIDFYADWCGPCRQLGPVLENKQKQTKKFRLLKVNVDDYPDIAEKFVTSGIPHVILFRNGKKEREFVGYDIGALNNLINSL